MNELIKNLDPKSIINAIDKLKYELFEDSTKPYNLNIIGVRSSDMESNTFNDARVYLIPLPNGQWTYAVMPSTTDPGLFWLKKLGNQKGTAIVPPGQHRGLWKIGKHRGKYKALVQRKEITVFRDVNRDKKLDYTNPDTGYFGINSHRANVTKKSIIVDKWSAGCQVTADPHDYMVENFNVPEE